MQPTTFAHAQTIYEAHIKGTDFGAIRLDKLTVKDVEVWKSRLRDTCKDASVKRYLSFLQARLAVAVDRDLILTNPAEKVKKPVIREDQEYKRVLSPEERQLLLDSVQHQQLRTAILLMLHGLRRGEACGLRYEDYDGEGIEVMRQVVLINDVPTLQERLKTERSHRWVPIVSAELITLLGSKPTGFVLLGAKGGFISPRLLRDWWDLEFRGKRRGKPIDGYTAGPFADMTPHDLRSTRGMMLLESGADLRTASEIMGHSPKTLTGTYARSRRELKLAQMQRAPIASPTASQPTQPTLF